MTQKNNAQLNNNIQSYSSLNERSSDLVTNSTNTIPNDLILVLQTAIDQTGSYIFTKDTVGRYTYVNLKVQELFGAKFDDIIGKDDAHYFDLEISNDIRLSDRRVLDFDVTIEKEEVIVIKATGEKRIYWSIKKSIKNKEGQIIGMCGVSTDITGIKRRENLLRESSENLNELKSIAGPGSNVLDISTGAWKSSPVLDQIFGIDESFLRTVDDWKSIINIDDRTMLHDYFLSEVIQDISRRIIIEQSLSHESEKNFTLLRNASDGVHIIDIKGNVIEASDSFCQMLGYTREEIIGMHISQWDSILSDTEIGSMVAQQLDSKTRSQFETRHRRKDGTELDVEVSGYPVELLGKRVLFNSSRDITERKKAERLLEKTKNELLEVQRIAHLGSWSLNVASNEISWSEELYFMMGINPNLTPPNLPDSHNLFMPESWGRLSSAIALTVTSGVPFKLELEMVKTNGSPGWMLWRGEAVRDESDSIISVRGVAEDITERKLSEIALKESELRYQIIFDMNPLPMWIFDDSTLVFLMVNQFAVDHYGYSREEFSRMSLRDIRPKEDIAELDRIVANYPNRRSVGEKRHIKKDGTIIIVIINTVPMIFGNRHARIAIIQDITERKRVENSLSITASVFGISQEAITITDADNKIIDVNPAFTKITGFSREEVIGKNPNFLSSGRQSKGFYENMWAALNNEGVWRGEIWNRKKSGAIYPEMLSISVLRDNAGKVLTHVAVFSDISNLKQHEDELVRAAHFDALTSIPNRILLADRMKHATSQTARDKNMMAVCYLDLDGFKPINDTMGHQVGDDVLIEIARRIGVTIRGGDTVARLGGDEFVVLLLGLAKGEECVTTIERLLDAIAAPITVKNKAVSVTASIGVSIYPHDEEDPDTLLRHADQAMYVAKQSGKNRFHIYDVDLDKRARDQNDFLKSIRTALEQNQFELHYQPKVNLRTKKLVGAEALLRWNHPERGLLSPAEFLRQVENTELDIQIGEWVTANALAQIHLWRRMGFNIEVSINISGYHLETKDFMSKLQQQLAHYPALPFGKLQIEVLETVALNDVTVVQEIIESCRKIGVGFALDDFGTGYSSLSYLSALPVDTLKIDQSFVRDMMEDKGDKAIVQGIIALAKAFGRQTVAEGIETNEQYQLLLYMGCEIGQGYGIARPMPAEDLAVWHADSR
jgi:diguanylate cyclase (GGDEF)-like protein/PAS domain S-box-containing protein